MEQSRRSDGRTVTRWESHAHSCGGSGFAFALSVVASHDRSALFGHRGCVDLQRQIGSGTHATSGPLFSPSMYISVLCPPCLSNALRHHCHSSQLAPHLSRCCLEHPPSITVKCRRRQGCQMSCQPGLLGPDLLHGERRHQLSVALDVGRRPEGRRPGGAGATVGPGRLPATDAAGPGGAVAAAALVAVGLGQLGQVDARP